MSPQTIKVLNHLNEQFYTQNAASFSASRQSPWKGWSQLVPYFPREAFDLLDVGCGNGRFERFLLQHTLALSSYTGLDASPVLLKIAREHVSTLPHISTYKPLDLTLPKSWPPISRGFDVVVMLAVLHHIPSRTLRLELVEHMASLLRPKGVLIISLWHYESDARFQRKIIPWDQVPEIPHSELEAGDYVLSWNNDFTIMRYVHVFSELEVQEVVSSSGLHQIKAFWADGQNQGLNQYLVLSKDTVQ